MISFIVGSILLAGAVSAAEPVRELRSQDAYLRSDGHTWTLGTDGAERVLAFQDGRLVLRSCRYAGRGENWAGKHSSPQTPLKPSVPVGTAPASPSWTLVNAETARLKQGELQLVITLKDGSLIAKKTYVLYPGSSLVREWVTFMNAGAEPIRVVDPRFLNVGLSIPDPASLDFHWMTGGENQPGSWVLKTEKLTVEQARTFDSYDPFASSAKPEFPGEGVNAKIMLNDQQVWPEKGWQYVQNALTRVPFDLALNVKPGDRLAFVVNMHVEIGWDTTEFDPRITYADGEAHRASTEFSSQQGEKNWRYGVLQDGKFVELVFKSDGEQFRPAKDNTTRTPFVGRNTQHPDIGQDAARVWTASRGGAVRVTGSVCNTTNGINMPGSYGFRMGSSTYAPWYALYNRTSKSGLVIGWDYIGHWASSFKLVADNTLNAELHVAGHKQTLAPDESVTTPKAFTALYADDLDNAGNEVLDWQYRYMWDYTRDGWFPAIRTLGYWMKGTGWGMPGVPWTGGKPDLGSAFRKVFRVADLMRSIGADVYHRDWGWWDRAGDWNGPDFRGTGDYLRKHGMGQLIYAFLYTVDLQSKVAHNHPEWLIGNTLDMSRPEVVAFMKGQLDEFVKRWGDFEWRNDSTPTCPKDGDDTPLLGQDQGLRDVIRGFLDAHPPCAFQAVNGGGNNAGYDYARYASTVSFSDGAVGIMRNYYASLLLPPDKTSDIPDVWDPNKYDKATWRGLLCINFDMTGDTWDPARLEGLRELIDVYHYLHKKGVAGRWVHVHRPLVTGDDPTMYLERLSRDGRRGLIIPKRPAPQPVVIRPKGLLPEEDYVVSFHEDPTSVQRKGADLMQAGISIDKMPPGELIYLNLPLHPGSRLDRQPPAAPDHLTRHAADNMGYPGVELTWLRGADDNWVSYYELFRNGKGIDKVAKGTFYFDHSAGADVAADYAVRTVDGAGNVSPMVSTGGSAAQAAQVIDDAPGSGIAYTGEWQHPSGFQPAHAGTLSLSKQKGAAVELTFTGRRLLWFSKLGADCGKAEVTIDGAEPVTVDTYSADDIWGVCVFRKDLDATGSHDLRIVVTGERTERAGDVLVHLDGIRIEK